MRSRVVRLWAGHVTLVDGSSHANLTVVLVKIAPLEPEEFTATQPTIDRQIQDRVVGRLGGFEQSRNILGFEKVAFDLLPRQALNFVERVMREIPLPAASSPREDHVQRAAKDALHRCV